MLVFLHGTGGRGSLVMSRLRALAERAAFIAIAPDSVSVAGVWLVEHGPGGATEDHRHVVRGVKEVLAVPGVRVDRARVLIGGFSVGGGAAASIATHEDLFTAFAVLHGHVTPSAMGPRRPRGWLSTGDRDRVQPIASLRSLATRLKSQESFSDVEARVFVGEHSVSEAELAALVAWWLRP